MAVTTLDLVLERPGGEAPRPPVSQRGLPDRRNPASREALLRRVRAEFNDLRGLKLTLPQAERLFGMREDVCVRVMNALIREGLLRLAPGDLYARRQIDHSKVRLAGQYWFDQDLKVRLKPDTTNGIVE